jgi:hypothetical protein
MLDFIKQVVQAKGAAAHDFNLGYLTGVGVVLLIVLVLLVIRIIFAIAFRRKRCNGITIKDSKGDVFISRPAVETVVKSLEKDFKFLTISKVGLWTRKRVQYIKIYIDFDASGGGLPPQASGFQDRVLAALKDVFGIESVRKVYISLRKVKLNELPPAKPEIKHEESFQPKPVLKLEEQKPEDKNSEVKHVDVSTDK